MEPVSLYISDPSNPTIEEKNNTNDTSIIESSSIPSTSIEETENPIVTIPNVIPNKKDDDNSKTITLVIVFASIGGVLILGGIIAYIIYKKNKAKNININDETNFDLKIKN